MWLDRLRPHLKLLDRLGRIRFWDDRSIETGDRWWQDIQTQMSRARGRLTEARRDWEEARRSARRGGMRLRQIDADLEEARLALAEGRAEAVRAPLERARAEIEATGYHRRAPEVDALEQAVLASALA